jgi:drug/metabolite transporter (DMT)-like permease
VTTVRDRTAEQHSTLGLVAVITAIVGLSLGSTIVKKTGAPGLTVATWRIVFGAAIWLVVLHLRRGRLTKRAVRLAGLPAVFFAADLAIFFVAVTRTSVANAEFIGSLVPVVVVPLAAWLFHERLRPVSLVWAGLALVGIAIVLFNAPPNGASSLTGNLLTFVAMSTWAGYLLTGRRARATLGTTEFMTTVAVLGALILVPIAAVSGRLWEMPAGAWKYVILLAVMTGTVCHGLLAWAQTRVPVSTIAIMQVASPALATLWAFLILDETISGTQAIGMALVVGSLAAFIISSRRAVSSVTDNGELGGPSG